MKWVVVLCHVATVHPDAAPSKDGLGLRAADAVKALHDEIEKRTFGLDAKGRIVVFVGIVHGE